MVAAPGRALFRHIKDDLTVFRAGARTGGPRNPLGSGRRERQDPPPAVPATRKRPPNAQQGRSQAQQRPNADIRAQQPTPGQAPGQLGVLLLIEAVIGPEVNQFFFGELMWRYVAAKRFACSERPGVN